MAPDIKFLFMVLLVGLFGILTGLLMLPFFQYIVGAGLIAFVLYPIHMRLKSKTGERLSAGLLTFLATVGTILPMTLLGIAIFQTLDGFAKNFNNTEVFELIRTNLSEFGLDDETLDQIMSNLEISLQHILQPTTEQLLSELTGILSTTLQVSVGIILSIFLIYYFLKDGEVFIKWGRGVAPLDTDVSQEFIQETSAITWAVLKSHVFVAIVQGFLGSLGLFFVGIPNAILLGFVMVVMSILPAIGIWLVWLPAALYLLAIGNTLSGIALLIYGVAVLSVVDNYLRAYLVQNDAGVHPGVVLVGVLSGVAVFGFLGLFLGPIIIGVFKASANFFSQQYSEDPVEYVHEMNEES